MFDNENQNKRLIGVYAARLRYAGKEKKHERIGNQLWKLLSEIPGH